MSIGIIILAAGSSSRLGQSKQLVTFENKPLLRRTAEVALSVSPDNVIVVLGSDEDVHQKTILDLPLKIIHNEQWEKGMGNSLKTGLSNLLAIAPETEAVIFLVCDQPYLKSETLKNMIREFRGKHQLVIASAYADTIGVPALFEKSTFARLLTVDDSQGAKKILQHYAPVRTIPFPDGAIDIDTPEDLKMLR